MSAESTIRDVARYANVSIATVSRVLNNSPAVREKTRHRVEEAIEALDYSPNPIARKLSRGRTHTIAVVLPLFTLPSFVERLRGVHQKLVDNAYDLVLYSIESDRQWDEQLARLASLSRVDGLLLISLPPNDEQTALLLENGVPTVLIDAHHDTFRHVIVDDEAGGQMATSHLIELGHKRIAFLSDFLDTPFHQSMRLRYRGYRGALAVADIPFRDSYHVCDTHGRHEARVLTRDLLKLDDPPTAVFASSDTQAIGVLDAAQDLNVRIPDELSVIGFDGIRDAEYLDLTTIEQPLYQSGIAGAGILLDMLRNEPDGMRTETVLPLNLIRRATTAPPPAGRAKRTGSRKGGG
ncbi:MAG TPA: LacI family DNA-binding transcriptional regulator [Anaerolineales bacterium]|nr:LacI family DNA-binding transcriptional regulator [Anaerolineales bacterium]